LNQEQIAMSEATTPVDVHAAQVRKFKLQDMVFHQVTLVFAFIVLAALVGILISLAIEAMPVFKAFGPASCGPTCGMCRKTSTVPCPPSTARW
jgi:ABC-type phosphate transport system permease subunit